MFEHNTLAFCLNKNGIDQILICILKLEKVNLDDLYTTETS